jgi:anti-anti-sigma factor
MATQPFDVEITYEAETPTLNFQGDINALAESALLAAYSEVEAKHPARVVFNFSNVEYINSTGIAIIVGLLAKARAAQRITVATGLSDHYKEIFTITRLSDFMEIE